MTACTTIHRRGWLAMSLAALGLRSAPVGASEPRLLLAREAAAGVEPAPYLVSEKYDGVRGLWTGRELRFRSGARVPAPAWFLARLPAEPLDGELWLGRGRFESLCAAVRRDEPRDDEWRAIRYMVFELPGADGSFEARVARIQAVVVRTRWAQLQAAPQQRVADAAALSRRLDEVVRGGGEGLMLHRASARYQTGRGDALLKLKPVQDAEASVVAHLAGQGKHAGRLGALQVRTPDGRRFSIGTGFSDAQRDHPPPLGSEVTYTYRGVTDNGVPRFASFVRVRDGDL